MAEDKPVFIFGEVFGHRIQDLQYGCEPNKLSYRVFDVAVGKGNFLNDAQLDAWCVALGLQRVPVLYRGPFNKSKIIELTDGNETVSGKGLHMREGVVVRPVIERYDLDLGRVILKNVSERYLLRKGGTEHN